MKKGNKVYRFSLQAAAHKVTAIWLLLLLHTLGIQGVFQDMNQFKETQDVLYVTPEEDIPFHQDTSNPSSTEETTENTSSVFSDYLLRASEGTEYYPLMSLQITSGEEIFLLLIRNKTIPTPPPEC